MEPDHIVRIEGIGGRDKFYDIGVASKSTRGSITIYPNAYPLNNRVFLIPTKKKEKRMNTLI